MGTMEDLLAVESEFTAWSQGVRPRTTAEELLVMDLRDLRERLYVSINHLVTDEAKLQTFADDHTVIKLHEIRERIACTPRQLVYVRQVMTVVSELVERIGRASVIPASGERRIGHHATEPAFLVQRKSS